MIKLYSEVIITQKHLTGLNSQFRIAYIFISGEPFAPAIPFFQWAPLTEPEGVAAGTIDLWGSLSMGVWERSSRHCRLDRSHLVHFHYTLSPSTKIITTEACFRVIVYIVPIAINLIVLCTPKVAVSAIQTWSFRSLSRSPVCSEWSVISFRFSK